MRCQRMVVATLAVAVGLFALSTTAFAVTMDNVELAGKAIHTIEKRGDRQVEIFAVVVKSATAKDGDTIVELAGKTVAITGPETAEIAKSDGHKVLAFGTLSEDKTTLEADSVIKVPPAKNSSAEVFQP